MFEYIKNSRILKIILNKYVIVILVFAVIILFFDKNNLINHWKTKGNIKRLEKEIQFYKNEIESDKEQLMKLQADTQTLEKFARENYYFKKENEDIFIINDDEISEK